MSKSKSNILADWNSLKGLRALQTALSVRMVEVEREYSMEFCKNPHRFKVVFDIWWFDRKSDSSLGKLHSFKNQVIDYEYRKRGETVDVLVLNESCRALFPDIPENERPTIQAHIWHKAENVKVFSRLARLDHWPRYSAVRVV